MSRKCVYIERSSRPWRKASFSEKLWKMQIEWKNQSEAEKITITTTPCYYYWLTEQCLKHSQLKLRNGAYGMYMYTILLSNVRAFYRLPFNYAIYAVLSSPSSLEINIECKTRCAAAIDLALTTTPPPPSPLPPIIATLFFTSYSRPLSPFCQCVCASLYTCSI